MRNTIRVIILISILPLFLITGCVSSGTMPERGKVQLIRPPALSNEILDKRIDEIKHLLEQGSLSDDRKETAISILKAYDKLRSLNRENSTEKEYRKTVQLLFNSLISVEKQYLYSGMVSGEAVEKKIIEDYSTQKKQIYDDYFAGDFKGVISGCNELMSRFGKSGLTPDLGIVLVESLLKNDMPSDALTVAKSILGTVESRPDLIRLLADAIELELKTGNSDDAKRLYEKLVDNINEKNSTYQRAGNLLSEYQGGSPLIDETVKEKISRIDPETELLIDNVKKLLSQKDFSGARLELYRRKLRTEEGPDLEVIEQLLNSVNKAEEQFNKENTNEKLKIDDARKLIEEEKFEEALDILDPIVAGGENYEADKLKKEAVKQLIERDIKIAGKLRVAAIKEGDKQKKRDLLLKARSILQNLIDKYPTSPSIDSVKKYISVVNEDLINLQSTND